MKAFRHVSRVHDCIMQSRMMHAFAAAVADAKGPTHMWHTRKAHAQ